MMRYERVPAEPVSWHPYADLFPWIEGPAFRELVEDIRKNGVLEPIVFLDGTILDGRNRYMAAREVGVAYPRVEFDGDDPLAFVIAKNLARRHLSESQRAMVAAKLAKLPLGANQHREAGSENLPTQMQAAEMLNVSDRSVRSARTVHEQGVPELIAAVEKDELSVSAAADLTALPIERQIELIKNADPKALATIVREVREQKQSEKRARREQREADLGARISALPDARFGVILADPEWRFAAWSSESGMDRAAENHYPTSPLDVIKARPVADIAADDCVLFLWATAPMLTAALEVMTAWGFSYKTNAVWTKDHDGTGYWFRFRHELLLVGTRGNVVAPAPGSQSDSVFEEPRGEHSAKPEAVAEMIERLFPSIPKIELNRRGPARPGWSAWGNETEAARQLEAAE